MRKLIVFLMSIFYFVCLHAEEFTDEQIFTKILRCYDYCHHEAQQSALKRVMRQINYDTNRFVRVIEKGIENEDSLNRMCLLNTLRDLGDKTAIPIFYKYIADSNCLCQAAWGVLTCEGLTSNSVMKISEQIQRFKDTRPAFDAFGDLMHYASKEKDGDIHHLAVNKGILYATKNPKRLDVVDKVLMEADESYRMSKRRLNVLRSAYAVGLTKGYKEYAEKVIKELEAYPEEKLPE